MSNDERSEMGVIRNQLVCSVEFNSKLGVHRNKLFPVSWNIAGHCENLPLMHTPFLFVCPSIPSVHFGVPIILPPRRLSLPSPQKRNLSFILSEACFLGLANREIYIHFQKQTAMYYCVHIS